MVARSDEALLFQESVGRALLRVKFSPAPQLKGEVVEEALYRVVILC